ncbi:MAG TPA: TMEM175 family protein [Solirubrobacteraceae bacterium]|jgi:uncharacterized membrane protein|nr:TMEM175 family protein [Solirubrobacteraceae bacterium]
MSPTRLEAFSDGVIAIAITLLVLDIHVPKTGPGMSLARALGQQWPHYVAYFTSFLTIGIIWINHHAAIRRLGRVDHAVMTLNILLLLTIGLLPFTTALAAEYLKLGHGAHLAVAIYSGSYLLMSIAFIALNRHILLAKPQLHRVKLSEQECKQILRRNVTGLLPYALATALAVVSPYITLAICGAVAIFYALPFASADSSTAIAPGG